MQNKTCYDCGVAPGSLHLDGCDMAQCTVCLTQCLSCDCDGHHPGVWTGERSGVIEARTRGWFCQDGFGPDSRWGSFCPCPEDAPGAMPDLNRWFFFQRTGADTKYEGCPRVYRR